MSALHTILALFIVIIWGSFFVVTKEILTYLEPFQAITLRFILLLPLLLFFPRPPAPLPFLFGLTATFSLGHIGCTFLSLHYGLDTSLAVVLEQICIPLVILLSVLFLGDSIRKRGIISLLLALLGTAILAGTPNSISHPIAVVLILVSALCWAIYNIQLKKGGYTMHPVGLMVWMNLMAIPVLLPVSLVLEGNLITAARIAPAETWLWLVYLSLGVSVASHGLWYYLVQHNPISLVAPFILLTPVVGVITSVIVYNEPVTLPFILGGILIIAGVALAISRQETPLASPPD